MTKLVLNLNLEKMKYLENTMLVSFEHNEGKIETPSISGTGLHCNVDFNEAEKKAYKIIAFDNNGGRHIKEQIEKSNSFDYIRDAGFRIKLLKQGKTIDEYNDPEEQHPQKKVICVFLCHRYIDKPTAKIVAKYLKEAGIEYFLDEENIKEIWTKEIEEALQKTTHFILILTENFKTGITAHQELGYAACLRKFDKINLIKILNFDKSETPKILTAQNYHEEKFNKPENHYKLIKKIIKEITEEEKEITEKKFPKIEILQPTKNTVLDKLKEELRRFNYDWKRLSKQSMVGRLDFTDIYEKYEETFRDILIKINNEKISEKLFEICDKLHNGALTGSSPIRREMGERVTSLATELIKELESASD